MSRQKVLLGEKKYNDLFDIIEFSKIKKLFVVCGKNTQRLAVWQNFVKECGYKNISYYLFDKFEANPQYQSVTNGIDRYKINKCDAIMAIGGGSAIDVAKCIKMFMGLDKNQNYLFQEIKENNTILIALPTTAGTGAEATKFAVIYHDGNKYSVNHTTGLPNIVVLEPLALESLPIYQRKVTALDVLAHGLESYWSVNSTEKSRIYSKAVIEEFFSTYKGYLENNAHSNERMLILANKAGMAINIAQTTAAHAMSYKLTSYFGIAHGHAVGLCLPVVIRYMDEHMDRCQDQRGIQYVKNIFNEIAYASGFKYLEDLIKKIEQLVMTEMELDIPVLMSDSELNKFTYSVNVERLRNTPIKIDEISIEEIYKNILNKDRRN